MPTIRLIPSILYYNSSPSVVQNESNAFTNTDSETYARIQKRDKNYSAVLVYLRGFNFSDVPSDATINSFSIKLKATANNEVKYSKPDLCNGSSVYNDTNCDELTTTVAIHEFSFTQDYVTFASAGDNFGIRFNLGVDANGLTFQSQINIYGAEIEVNYTELTKYLNKTGLATLWGKIKGLIPANVSDLNNDACYQTQSQVNALIAAAGDDNTTYAISISGNVITLTGSDGNTSTVTLPVYTGGVV